MNKPKTYSKLVFAGDVIYWREYEKPPTVVRKRPPEDDFNALDILDTKLEEGHYVEERSRERRSQTLRDGSETVKLLALMNFTPGKSTFVTLTFEDHVTAEQINYADGEFKKFFKRLRYKMNDPNLKYLAVRELTKRGRIHYHLLINSLLGLPPLPEGYLRYKGPDGKTYNNKIAHQYELDYVYAKETEVAGIWKHGKIVDVKPMYEEVDNLGAYLVKYMTKNIALELFPGKKFYLSSQGLDRPQAIAGEAAEELIQLLNLRQKKEVFGNSYITEYQGICQFKEINLKRSLLPV